MGDVQDDAAMKKLAGLRRWVSNIVQDDHHVDIRCSGEICVVRNPVDRPSKVCATEAGQAGGLVLDPLAGYVLRFSDEHL
jgi:hypothetical protein